MNKQIKLWNSKLHKLNLKWKIKILQRSKAARGMNTSDHQPNTSHEVNKRLELFKTLTNRNREDCQGGILVLAASGCGVKGFGEEDFKKEEANIEAFRGYLKSMGLTRQATAPRVYPECNTKKVMTMERLYEVPLTDLDIFTAHQAANSLKSKSLEQRADAMGRADALRSMADALGRWADEYLLKADATVTSEPGRITLALKHSLCSSTDAFFFQEYFILEEKTGLVFCSTAIFYILNLLDSAISFEVLSGTENGVEYLLLLRLRILMNGKPVEKRTYEGCCQKWQIGWVGEWVKLSNFGTGRNRQAGLDLGPQLPTHVTNIVKSGTNLLQAVGNFDGKNIILVAFMSMGSNPRCPELPEYVVPAAATSDSDNDIIEGPSRISLNCPIRFKLDISGEFRKGALPGILSLSTKFLPTVTNLLRKLAEEGQRPARSDVHRNTSSPPKASRVIYDIMSNSGLSSIASSEMSVVYDGYNMVEFLASSTALVVPVCACFGCWGLQGAVAQCIAANKMADALVIAQVGGDSLWESTLDQYLKNNSSPYLKFYNFVSAGQQVKNALKKHFGNYGEITRTFIPKDYESGPGDPRGPRDDSSGPRRTPESVMKEGPGKRARLGSDNRSCEPRRPFVPTRPRGPSKPSITTQAKGQKVYCLDGANYLQAAKLCETLMPTFPQLTHQN
ncbi:hypothetical protein Tco_0128483 [Tanacetum coccineum]